MKNLLPQRLNAFDVQGVNFNNGFLTREMQLIPHQPEQGMSYMLPFSYQPEASGRCPKFFQYLHDVWGHNIDYKDKVAAVREAMCVTLFGLAPSFQRCFLLYGTADSGKSVLLEIIEQLVPDEARCSLSPDKWGGEFNASRFVGKLLNKAGELPEKDKINGAIFKQIVSGDEMDVRFLYQNLFKFRPKCAHWFASNHLPKSADMSNGFNRRWLIFEFDKVIPPEKKIIEFSKQIVNEEIEAIVAWVVEILPDLLQRNNFTLPESHIKMANTMALSNSSIRSWLHDKIIASPESSLKFKDMWNDFWSYCANMLASKTTSVNEFKKDLHQFLNEINKLNVVPGPDGDIYKGLAFKNKK